MLNKRGEDTDTRNFLIGFAIVAVVGFLVIAGFTGGLKTAWQKLVSAGGGKDTVSLVSSNCKILCDQGTADNYAGYCGDVQDVVYNKVAYNATCNNLALGKIGNGTPPAGFPVNSFACPNAGCTP